MNQDYERKFVQVSNILNEKTLVVTKNVYKYVIQVSILIVINILDFRCISFLDFRNRTEKKNMTYI